MRSIGDKCCEMQIHKEILFTSTEYLKYSISCTPELKVSLTAFLVSSDTSLILVKVSFNFVRISSIDGTFYKNSEYIIGIMRIHYYNHNNNAHAVLCPVSVENTIGSFSINDGNGNNKA